jgi:hypothetical protein
MISALLFLQQIEIGVYLLLAALSIRYFVDWARVHAKMKKSIFRMEREIFQQKQTAAATGIMILLVTGSVVFLATNYALPELRRANTVRLASTVTLTAPTPSPTPWMVDNVDISGCTNAHATITSPKPGDTIQGKVDIRGTVDVDLFTFYKIELGKPDLPDVWNTLYTQNKASQNEVLYTWDTSIWDPGVYHLRLVVQLRDGSSLKPCIVPVQIFAAQ